MPRFQPYPMLLAAVALTGALAATASITETETVTATVTEKAGPWRVCDVSTHGAKGDNRTKDTAAIVAAVAACKGGGVILLPAPGLYLTGLTS